MKYYLHYVGSRLYPKETFIKEAQEIGVNRCLPLRLLKKVKWGDHILLGTYIPKPIVTEVMACPTCKTEIQTFPFEKEDKTYIDVVGCPTCNKPIAETDAVKIKRDGRKNKKEGTADVFGYFEVRGLNITASDTLKQQLFASLNIVKTTAPNTKIQRQCGSYVIAQSYVVTDTIEDIVEKAETLAFQAKENIKIFIGGNFVPLNLTISPVNFSRTIVTVDINQETCSTDGETIVNSILDYEKRQYIKTYAKRGRPRKETK